MIRPGLNYLVGQGYVPMDSSAGCCNFYGPAANTLEYASADFSTAAFAQELGNARDGFLEPRSLDGSFPASYDPTSGTGWVEDDGAQYNWMVPFNLAGLCQALGGNSAVVSRLNTFFAQLNGGPTSSAAFPGNEPTLETPWEYDDAGAPYRTQSVVRQVENTLYSTGPGGLAGNDDLGEMSSWYVWATLGLFPETPGTANLALSSPLFPAITINRPGGQTITISAPGASSSTFYVQSLLVNATASNAPGCLPRSSPAAGRSPLRWQARPTPPGAAASNASPSYGSVTSSFATSFASGQPPLTWTNTVDSAGYPAGGLNSMGGICCGLSGPEAGTRNETAHTGGIALMYSGLDTSPRPPMLIWNW